MSPERRHNPGLVISPTSGITRPLNGNHRDAVRLDAPTHSNGRFRREPIFECLQPKGINWSTAVAERGLGHAPLCLWLGSNGKPEWRAEAIERVHRCDDESEID